jgi:hypothetical protein
VPLDSKPAPPKEASSSTGEAPQPGSEKEKPADFSGSTVVANAVATGLGCEARSKDGWLQLLCRKKNGAGGHPKRAVLGAEGSAPEIGPDDQSELSLVIPFRTGTETTGFIEWTDTKYDFKVKDEELRLEWVVTLEMRRACAELEKASKEVVSTAQKGDAPDRLTAMEAAKLPHFGTCQSAGHGSWAVALHGIEATGDKSARRLSLDVEVARVGEDGMLTKADFGKIVTVPGGFELRPLQVYDYDDDGSSELIVPYDLKAIPAGATPVALSAVWTHKAGAVSPLTTFSPTLGGLQTTHLEYDMRPDLGRYDPFVSYLPTDCGAANCPTRLVGPPRFARSLPNGAFALTEPQAQAALTRACPKTTTIVVDGNPSRTAQNVACARLRGEESKKLEADLKAKSSTICKGTESCALLDALIQFANQTIPSE